jgi:hypothetical protein
MNSDNNIHEDSEDKAPNLNSSGSGNPFGPGNDYFENFQSKIMFRVEEFEELKMEAPFLSNIPKYNPFAIPAGYFDELPSLIQEKCINTKSGISLKEWLLMLFRPNFAIPVLTIILIAFSAIYYLEKDGIKSENFTVEEVNVEEQLQNIDESTLIDALAAQVNNETGFDNDNDKIMNYLLDNNVDETSLSYEL